MFAARYGWILLLFVFIIVLTSLSEKSEEEILFVEYAERLRNVLDSDEVFDPELLTITLPRKRDVGLNIPPVTMGLLESYGFRQCGLFNVIAEKNSILGKVQDQFANFDYQVLLLNTIEECLGSNALSETEKNKLEEIYAVKTIHLPLHWHNLVGLSDETRTQLSENRWLAQSEFFLTSLVEPALKTLLLNHPDSESKSLYPVSNYQQNIEQTPLVGPLMFSITRATQWLEISTSVMVANESKVFCEPNRDRTTFEYLKNVFGSQFTGKVQPYISQLDQLYFELNPYLSSLSKPFGDTRLEKHQELHQEFRQAVKGHIKVWQNIFDRCGHRIGN